MPKDSYSGGEVGAGGIIPGQAGTGGQIPSGQQSQSATINIINDTIREEGGFEWKERLVIRNDYYYAQYSGRQVLDGSESLEIPLSLTDPFILDAIYMTFTNAQNAIASTMKSFTIDVYDHYLNTPTRLKSYSEDYGSFKSEIFGGEYYSLFPRKILITFTKSTNYERCDISIKLRYF